VKLYSRFELNARVTFKFLQFFHSVGSESVDILSF
jgi:hypothetical protein